MGDDHSDTQTMRTWFGLTARVTIGQGFIHKAGIGRLAIPHPPVANWLLRQGLPADVKRGLSFAHEFAHFQTGPVVLLYMILLSAACYMKGRIGPAVVLQILVSAQAVWEMLSESVVVLTTRAPYRKSYQGIIKLPRFLSWLSGAVLTAAGWLVVI